MSGRRRSPLQRCPICDSALRHVQVASLGAVTANIPWEMHAGQCPTHGWFQAEVISRPPREIFPVSRPGGVAQATTVDGHVVYAFPTRWNTQNTLKTVDPFDSTWWAVDWDQLPMDKPVSAVGSSDATADASQPEATGSRA